MNHCQPQSLAQDVPNTNPEPGVEGDLIVMEEEKSQKRIVPGPVADVNGSQAPSLDEVRRLHTGSCGWGGQGGAGRTTARARLCK